MSLRRDLSERRLAPSPRCRPIQLHACVPLRGPHAVPLLICPSVAHSRLATLQKRWRNCLYRAKADSQRTDKWETHTNKCGPREPPTLVLAPLKLVSPWPLLLGNKTTSLPNSATSTFFVQSRRPSSVRSFFCSEVYKLRPSANNPWEESLL